MTQVEIDMYRERVTRVRQTCIERGFQREIWREGDTGGDRHG